jgi:PRC-barrel domain
MADDRGNPIAYMVLAEGTRVVSSDGEEVGKVHRVLADTAADVFDGIVVDTSDGERFADASQVGDIFERLVVLAIPAEQARALPEHTASPGVLRVSPGDLGDDDRGAARRAWDRLSGNS